MVRLFGTLYQIDGIVMTGIVDDDNFQIVKFLGNR